MNYELESCTVSDLKKISSKIGLKYSGTKSVMILRIAQQIFDKKYTKHEQIGTKGKDGITYRVTDRRGKEYAMKTFKKKKSSEKIRKEYELQKKAARKKVAPKIYFWCPILKVIVMEKMDCHLYELLGKQGTLKKSQQLRLIDIYNKLDEAKVFHDDANICNYMVKNNEIYIIDFGFAKPITKELISKLKIDDRPNFRLMTLGFILKLKSSKYPEKSYKHMKTMLSKDIRERFGI